MHLRLLSLSAIAGFVFLAGACSKSNTGGGTDACDNACVAGELCVAATCRKICAADGDCSSGMICDDDLCTVGSRQGVPQITSVDGDSTVVSNTTEADGTPTEHRLRQEIIAYGNNLEGVSAALVSSGGATTNLAVTMATATQVHAVIPEEFAEGQYTLVLSNAADSAQATVWVLRGEQGPQGDAGDTPTTEDIQAAVSAMDTLDVTNLGGRPADGFQTTLSWGRRFECEVDAGTDGIDMGDIGTRSGASAGGVRAVLVTDDPAGTNGRIWGVSSTSIGELLADGASAVSLWALGENLYLDGVFINLTCVADRGAGEEVLASYGIDRTQLSDTEFRKFTIECPFAPTDLSQGIYVQDFVKDRGSIAVDFIRVEPIAERAVALTCPEGWWSAAGGRICMNSTMQAAGSAHDAIGTCRAMGARVCTHTDFQQICGTGIAPYGVAPGWYGDHGAASGGSDNIYVTWNKTSCDNDNDGLGTATNNLSAPYRCCL